MDKGKKKAEPTLADVFLYGKDIEESDDEDFDPDSLAPEDDFEGGSDDEDESFDEDQSEQEEAEPSASNDIEEEVKGLMDELEENGYPEAAAGSLRNGKPAKSAYHGNQSPVASSAGPSGSSSKAKRTPDESERESTSPNKKKPKVDTK